MAKIKIEIKEQDYQKPLVWEQIGNYHLEELVDRAIIHLRKKYGREKI